MKKDYSILYSRTNKGQVQTWQIFVEDDSFYTVEGIKDGTLTKSLPTVCLSKNEGKKNETSAFSQACKEVESKIKKKLEKGYHKNLKDIDNESLFFEPMLAEKYQKCINDVKFPCYIQGKKDGKRCIANKNGLWSRNGKPINSVPHIFEALKPLFDYNPSFLFDGELFSDKLKTDFNTLMSIASKKNPSTEEKKIAKDNIEYHIYDFPFWQDTFSKRFNELKKVLSYSKDKCLVLVDTYKVNSHEEIKNFYEKFVESGEEGAMIRNDSLYENKRTNNLLKYKEFQDFEYKILELIEGLGNKSRMCGALKMELNDGRTFNSNIKGGFDFYREMWKNKDKYIGKMATIQFFNLTPDGIPRFPYFLRLREEE